MHFLHEYLYFLAKTATTVVAILIILAGIIAIATKGKQKQSGTIKIKKINSHFNDLKDTIDNETLSKNDKKLIKKAKKSKDKESKNKKDKSATTSKPRLFIIDFNGDTNATAASSLRKTITAILLSAKEQDEVLLRLQSPGGIVHSYGFASSQLQRLRQADINLTIAVDKMAASGGYMMASVANTIIAAPFAVIGSIGVVAQIPNFHRLLDKKSIDFEQVTAGKYKRSLTFFGKNTDEGREKMQQDLEDIHLLFQQHIMQYRPQLDMDKVATGEHWYGEDAIKLQLIDSIQTSDDFILNAKQSFECFKLSYLIKPTLIQKLMHGPKSLIHYWTTEY